MLRGVCQIAGFQKGFPPADACLPGLGRLEGPPESDARLNDIVGQASSLSADKQNTMCSAVFVLLAVTFSFLHAQPGPDRPLAAVPHSLYQSLQYRCIGPFRAGRTVGAVGIPTQPNVFFIGVNNGGVWKTDDYGRTWKPIFDETSTGSIGDIAVSSSHPQVIYVGTGEGLHRPDLSVGDGMFKSSDGGKSWIHIGLADVQQVARVIVNPNNPDIVFVAGLGHPYASMFLDVFRVEGTHGNLNSPLCNTLRSDSKG